MQTLEVGLFLIVLLLEKIASDQAFVLERTEHFSVKLVGAGPRDGGDDRRPRILEFRLEVRADDTELFHRKLGKRIAAAHVLADDPALVDVALEADAVDEHVDLWAAEALAVAARTDAAAGKGLAELGLVDPDAGRKLREIDEVAIILGQVLDLLLADVGADFGRPGFHQAPTGDNDGARLCTSFSVRRRRDRYRSVDIECRALADSDDHPFSARGRTFGAADADIVRARTKPGEHVGTVRSGRRPNGRVRIDIDRLDDGAGSRGRAA